VKVPEQVIEHCAQHKLCKGCKIGCTAPVSDRDFDGWIESQIAKIEAFLAEKRRNSAEIC
jgi:hypothetical protein